MNCGIPYCQGTGSLAPHAGCPVNNQIPDWNDLVYHGDWDEAARNLHSTNNFPEFTGRVCPAPCEASCTLNIDENPVTIKSIECAIVDRAIAQGLKPEPRGRAHRQEGRRRRLRSGRAWPARSSSRAPATTCTCSRSSPRPAACCATAFPTSRWRSITSTAASRRWKPKAWSSTTMRMSASMSMPQSSSPNIDAVVLTGGAEKRRDLPVPGRELKGIHFAMEFLPQQNRRVAGEPAAEAEPILANGKHVVVIGGGDTGSDCIGTSIRQGALIGDQFRDPAGSRRSTRTSR